MVFIDPLDFQNNIFMEMDSEFMKISLKNEKFQLNIDIYIDGATI